MVGESVIRVLNLAPTGMVSQSAPKTPRSVAEDVRRCQPTIVHLHAYEDGRPTWKKSAYERLIGAVKEVYDGLICVSTSGRLWSEFEKRSECLEISGDLKPDMASLTLGSMNFSGQANVNPPATICDLAKKMFDNGITPELEAFNLGMINYGKHLIRKGVLKSPHYFNLIVGGVATTQVYHLPTMIEALPDCVWAAGGIGDYQLIANVAGLVYGGGVRIGLEDNEWWLRRERKTTNVELVRRIRCIAQEIGVEFTKEKTWLTW